MAGRGGLEADLVGRMWLTKQDYQEGKGAVQAAVLKAMFSLQPLRTSNLSGAFVQPRPCELK